MDLVTIPFDLYTYIYKENKETRVGLSKKEKQNERLLLNWWFKRAAAPQQ